MGGGGEDLFFEINNSRVKIIFRFQVGFKVYRHTDADACMDAI